ncbi:MAG: hypothetical protein PHX04_05085 [Bacilli bacterium]|nr:hypothetical protein [Bacilli bacterium]
MKKKDQTSILIIASAVIIWVFVSVIIINLLPNNNRSDLYYTKIDENLNAKI